MCTGRIDLAFVLRSFSDGADGVFIGGCHLGECNYVTGGNYYAANLVQLCKKLLGHIGMNPERIRIDWCDAGEGNRYAEIMNSFGKTIRDLGPLGQEENIGANELKQRLEEIL